MCFTPACAAIVGVGPRLARPEPAAAPLRGVPLAALLRGVNVGGRNRLAMADFRRLLAGLGFGRPETLIQSGNAVFDSPLTADAAAAAIGTALQVSHGLAVDVLVLDGAALAAALDHPFGPAADPRLVHAFFRLSPGAAPNAERIEALRAADEAVISRPGHLILHAPSGIGRSKLAAALPRLIPGGTTARNLATVGSLHDMIASRRRDGATGA